MKKQYIKPQVAKLSNHDFFITLIEWCNGRLKRVTVRWQ